MYAVIQTGGKQYRVSPGEKIRVEKLPGAVGTEVEFDQVVAVMKEPGHVLAGPEAGGARVRAVITGQGRGEKVVVFKFKRKKQYKRTIGHRQAYTEVRVSEIVT
ncbi:MAG: 50S ribosomal protein L21 [Bryobacteraceae bacterium]|jgi:large subunit ribosomal protein L21|nr:50S ribosomal protein L21 [Bryobacteraceae bacterium]